MEEFIAKRFVRSLRRAVEILNESARCYCYCNTKEFQEIHEGLKYAIGAVENGETFAGRLLYKNARKLAPGQALELARKANSQEEHDFFIYVSNMNLQRAQRAHIQKELELAGIAASEGPKDA